MCPSRLQIEVGRPHGQCFWIGRLGLVLLVVLGAVDDYDVVGDLVECRQVLN